MDRRERGGSSQATLIAALAGLQASIWTALPGIVQSYDNIKQTVTVQPSIKAKAQNPDGSFEWITLPLLLDCPVYFPNGGGVTLTFPVAQYDECLVVFASRCIDLWWSRGGIQEQAEMRMHDLSDGFAFVGFTSAARHLGGLSTTKTQLRSNDGATYIELDPAGNTKMHASGNAEVSCAGNLTLSGANVNITGVLTINGTPYLTHHHSGVQTGGSNTGNVV